MSDPVVVPALGGKAAFVRSGQGTNVINTHGQQSVDTWAFNRRDLSEFMSKEYSRADSPLTNRRRPILTIIEDTSGGIHDGLIVARDRNRYEEPGCIEYHDNRTDNLATALTPAGFGQVCNAQFVQFIREHSVD